MVGLNVFAECHVGASDAVVDDKADELVVGQYGEHAARCSASMRERLVEVEHGGLVGRHGVCESMLAKQTRRVSECRR